MKAIGFKKSLPISDTNSFVDINIESPKPSGYQILVETKALSVNPVDYKVRQGSAKDGLDDYKVIGYDAAGVVTAVGEKVKNYKVGDEVYYAGDITKAGSNSEFHLVDERIVGKKPKTLSFAQAAALPLTSITAWEALFDRLKISKDGADAGKSILIISGAGGVGSIAIQIAKKLAKLEVIATASRDETISWVKSLGADHVINHRNPVDEELKKINFETVDYVLILSDTDGHWESVVKAIKPQGSIATIVENDHPLDMEGLKMKSAIFAQEFMFTRSMFETDDINEQGKLLNSVADLIDNKVLKTTLRETFSPINAENLRKAHSLLEQSKAFGKVVLENWG